MAKWWEIESAIKDAENNIQWAKSSVVEFYPDDAPNFKDPDLDQLLANLNQLLAQFKTVFPEGIKQAINDEAIADDEMEALADAASY